MNKFAEAFKNRFSGFGISNEEIAVFTDVAQRAAATTGINLSEFFEILAGFCRVVDSFFKAVQDTADSLAEIFEQLDVLTLPPPLSRLQRLWRAQARRAERERERAKLRLYERWAAQRRYKPP